VSGPDLEHLFDDCPGLPGGCPRCAEIFDRLAETPAPPRPLPDPDTTFTCPDCKMTSPNRNDVENTYCGHCHVFQLDPSMPRCLEPTCPDFGDYSFGDDTCPPDHAFAPAVRSQQREHHEKFTKEE
jgi:hypothetical protein